MAGVIFVLFLCAELIGCDVRIKDSMKGALLRVFYFFSDGLGKGCVVNYLSSYPPTALS